MASGHPWDAMPASYWSCEPPPKVLLLSPAWFSAKALSRLHRRQDVGGVDAQLLESHVVEAEIRRRRVQRPERAVADSCSAARF